MSEAKIYLGDGAYAARGAWKGEVIVTTEDGISVQNQIHFEIDMVKKLLEFFEQQIEEGE